MKNQITATRVKTDDIKDASPASYQDHNGRGIVATITVFSDRAAAHIFESENAFFLAYGSRALARRWAKLAGVKMS